MEKTDAPSGPSMGISLRHMDFLSANGARARPWQNTALRYWKSIRFKTGWLILKDTNSAASYHTLVLIPNSTDLRPLILSLLHIHHLTIRNELTVRYTQNYTPFKIPTYPTHPDYYSLVIKFNVLGLSKFRFFMSGFIERG